MKSSGLSGFSVHLKPPGEHDMPQTSEPHFENFWSTRSGQGVETKSLHSNKFLGDANAAGLEITLWEPLLWSHTLILEG